MAIGWASSSEFDDGAADDILRIESRETPDEVFELPDVSRPAIALHPVHGVRIELLARQPFLLDEGEEVPGKIRDVLDALAQGRQAQGHHVEAKEQILAEEALLDQDPQVLVGGSDDPHVGLDGNAAADGGVFALLEDAQKAGLRLHGHVADLVEEQRAAFRLLETAGIARGRAREGSLLVAEQIGFDEFARDRRHVDRHERPLPALAVIVKRLGDEFLAGPGFAGDHHGQIGRHQPRERAIDVLHRLRAADQRDLLLVRLRRRSSTSPVDGTALVPTTATSSFRSKGFGRYS